MNDKTKKIIKNIFRIVPIILLIVMAAVFFKYKDEITVSNIAEHSPVGIVLSVLFVLALYAVKSLSVFFPILVLMAVGGYLFGGAVGLIVNIIGVGVTLTVPYLLGRLTFMGMDNSTFDKYPKMKMFIEESKSNEFLTSLFSRTLFFLPCDILSLYMGSIKMHYLKYISGGIIGFMPMTICLTVIGNNITDPTSPSFIIATITDILVTAVSILIYLIVKKVRKKKTFTG